MSSPFMRLPVLTAAALSVALVSCAPKAAPATAVKTATARAGRIVRNVELSGVLVPDRTVNIFSKMTGQATAVTCDVGSRVEQGQLLVQIDTRELDAQLAVAEAAVAGVRDQAEQVKSGVETARLNLEMAQRAYDRTRTLLEGKVVTQSQLDDAQTRLDLARTAAESAEQQYRTISGSGLAQAQAQVDLIKIRISNATIVSPLSGVVTNRNINPGEMVASLSTSLLAIADVATLKLQANVFQDNVVRMAIGDTVAVRVDAVPGIRYGGRIDQIGPIAAATGQYFPVVVSLKNDGRLLAGMTAKASFAHEAAEGIVIPLAALNDDRDGQGSVYVVSQGRVERRMVTLGARNDDDVQVLSGLAAGDVVAVSNVTSLQDGMEVTQ